MIFYERSAPLNLFLLYWTCSLVYRCGILHDSVSCSSAKIRNCRVMFSQTDILQNESCHPLSCILLFLLIWGQKFFYFFCAKHEKFSNIFPSLKVSKTTEPKQPHPRAFSFAVLIFWRLLLTSFYRILQTLLEN